MSARFYSFSIVNTIYIGLNWPYSKLSRFLVICLVPEKPKYRHYKQVKTFELTKPKTRYIFDENFRFSND